MYYVRHHQYGAMNNAVYAAVYGCMHACSILVLYFCCVAVVGCWAL